MDAYWEVYTANPSGRITVKMITDKAGYNRGTFYAYFLDIEDLVAQIEDGLMPSDADFAKLKEATLGQNIQEILEVFMEIDHSVGEKLSFLLGPKGSLSFQHKLKKTLKTLITKYLPLNLKASSPVLEYKTEALCGAFYETLCYWYEKGKSKFSPEEMITLMLDMLYNGLLKPVELNESEAK